ncbi:MAG: PilZ domain-containing protein [Pseudomonadales bacterium]|nr:PilZ domain-containing protein [Pseudomonadales bacterium]MBP9033674.1 PilZ domain-containing protein [Pseudomonadales bacterium]
MSQTGPLPRLAERRVAARIEVELPARLIAGDGRAYAATIRDISRGGALVHLAAAHAAALLPNTVREQPRPPVGVRLEFRLPAASHETAITIDCGIAHLRRIAAGQGAMGLGFRCFHAGSEHALARFFTV